MMDTNENPALTCPKRAECESCPPMRLSCPARIFISTGGFDRGYGGGMSGFALWREQRGLSMPPYALILYDYNGRVSRRMFLKSDVHKWAADNAESLEQERSDFYVWMTNRVATRANERAGIVESMKLRVSINNKNKDTVATRKIQMQPSEYCYVSKIEGLLRLASKVLVDGDEAERRDVAGQINKLLAKGQTA